MTVKRSSIFYSAVSFMIAASGCEMTQEAKDAIHESLTEAPTGAPISPIPTGQPTATALSCYTDHFQQPAEQITHSVDILFIGDTSGSMSDNRVKVANALYAFVGALPAGTDYRIGVVLAHTSRDPNVGNLYSSGTIPKVLDSNLLSQAVIQQDLKQIMLDAPDYKEEGEMGSYALLKAISGSKLAANRSLGFFRDNAALAVVTISDENDICAVYPNPLPADFHLSGFFFPNMPGMTASENSIRSRDCPNGISAQQVVSAIKNLQGDRPYVIGAVIHPDMNYNLPGSDSYGWGYADVVSLSKGLLVDIDDGDYTLGLSALGALTTTKINLLTDFKLTHDDINASSIELFLDGNRQSYEYEQNLNVVRPSALGHARSEIDVNYCLNSHPAPTPTVTVTPSPSPTPTVTATPSPSPSSTPSVTPSVTPSPSPSPSPSPTVTATPSPSPSPSPTSTCSGPFCGGGGAT